MYISDYQDLCEEEGTLVEIDWPPADNEEASQSLPKPGSFSKAHICFFLQSIIPHFLQTLYLSLSFKQLLLVLNQLKLKNL